MDEGKISIFFILLWKMNSIHNKQQYTAEWTQVQFWMN